MSDYVTEAMDHGDIYITERAPSLAWLDVDPLDETGDDTSERWCVLRGGEAPHCGPVMPWAAWVALARCIIDRHGDASNVLAEHKTRSIWAGHRMAIERQDDGRWRGVSPRNGTHASCEGTLAEVVTLARGILERDKEAATGPAAEPFSRGLVGGPRGEVWMTTEYREVKP
jgi:hypothetical protein